MEIPMALKVCQLCAVDFTLKHFLLPLVDGMSAQGWQVISVCSDGDNVSGLREQGYSIETITISRSLNVFLHLLTLWRLYRYFRKVRFDVVHTHTPVAALIARVAAFFAGVPLVVYTAHGFYFHDNMPQWKRRLFVWLEWVGGRFTHLLFTQSEEDAETAVVEKISPAEKVVAIGNGVDAACFNPQQVVSASEIKASLGIPPDAQVVGMIGRLVREKGVGEFLAAASKLAEERPDSYFLLVGERLLSDHNDPIEDVLQQAKRCLGERLVLAGYRTDTPEMLAAMDVFCLPSYREGMPRTIIEAMMMAKPVVATSIRGSREEVIEAETGILVPVKSADQLADAFRKILENRGWARELGEAGRRRALSLYDEKRVVRLQLQLIREYALKKGCTVDE